MSNVMRWKDDICALAERLISYIRMFLPMLLMNMLLSRTQGIAYPQLSINLSDLQVGCSVFALHIVSMIFGSRTNVSRGLFYELSCSLLATEISLFLLFLQHEFTVGLILLCLLLGGLIAVMTSGRNVLSKLYNQRYIPQPLMDDIIAASHNKHKSYSLILVAARRYLVMATAVVFAVPSLLTFAVYGFDPVEPRRTTSTAHALESVYSDNMLLANLSTIRLFDENEWIQLSDQAKANALQVIADIETHHLQIEPVTVVICTIDGPAAGQYSGRGRIVEVDPEKHRELRPAEFIETILHECRHAFQSDCVGAVDWGDPETANSFYYSEFRQWKKELNSPVLYEDDPEGYYQQSVERDARDYANMGIQDYYQCLQFIGLPSR